MERSTSAESGLTRPTAGVIRAPLSFRSTLKTVGRDPWSMTTGYCHTLRDMPMRARTRAWSASASVTPSPSSDRNLHDYPSERPPNVSTPARQSIAQDSRSDEELPPRSPSTADRIQGKHRSTRSVSNVAAASPILRSTSDNRETLPRVTSRRVDDSTRGELFDSGRRSQPRVAVKDHDVRPVMRDTMPVKRSTSAGDRSGTQQSVAQLIHGSALRLPAPSPLDVGREHSTRRTPTTSAASPTVQSDRGHRGTLPRTSPRRVDDSAQPTFLGTGPASQASNHNTSRDAPPMKRGTSSTDKNTTQPTYQSGVQTRITATQKIRGPRPGSLISASHEPRMRTHVVAAINEKTKLFPLSLTPVIAIRQTVSSSPVEERRLSLRLSNTRGCEHIVGRDPPVTNENRNSATLPKASRMAGRPALPTTNVGVGDYRKRADMLTAPGAGTYMTQSASVSEILELSSSSDYSTSSTSDEDLSNPRRPEMSTTVRQSINARDSTRHGQLPTRSPLTAGHGQGRRDYRTHHTPAMSATSPIVRSMSDSRGTMARVMPRRVDDDARGTLFDEGPRSQPRNDISDTRREVRDVPPVKRSTSADQPSTQPNQREFWPTITQKQHVRAPSRRVEHASSVLSVTALPKYGSDSHISPCFDDRSGEESVTAINKTISNPAAVAPMRQTVSSSPVEKRHISLQHSNMPGLGEAHPSEAKITESTNLPSVPLTTRSASTASEGLYNTRNEARELSVATIAVSDGAPREESAPSVQCQGAPEEEPLQRIKTHGSSKFSDSPLSPLQSSQLSSQTVPQLRVAERETFMRSLGDIYSKKISPHQGGMEENEELGIFWKNEQQQAPDLTNQVRPLGRHPVDTSGGFGDLFKGVWKKPDGSEELVAIKVLRAGFFASDSERTKKFDKALRREQLVWQKLQHDHILPLYGVVRDLALGHRQSFVCPWMERGSLTRLLEKEKTTCSRMDRLNMLCDVAKGLIYLHENEVVHGDLTSGNVLISTSGRALLCDFGLSRIVAQIDSAAFVMSQTSGVAGALRWMSPEIVRFSAGDSEFSVAPVTFQSDIYSFGCLALQTMSGKIPYYYLVKDTQVLIEIYNNIKPKRPTDKEIVITDELWTLIGECWADVPHHRPSAKEIVQWIDRSLNLE